jgi:hypothetical protein
MNRIPPYDPRYPRVASFPRVSTPVAGAPPSAAQPPVAPYDPPVVAGSPPAPMVVADGVGDGYESATRSMMITDIRSSALGGPTSVYATKKRWRAIDVYVETNYRPDTGVGLDPADFLRIGIFSIARGVRTFLAGGCVRSETAYTFAGVAFIGDPGPQRVAFARAQSDRFEVVVARGTRPVNPLRDIANISIVCSDEANDEILPGQFDGAVQPTFALLNGGAVATQGMAGHGMPIQMVALHAINTSGAVRYLQLLDGTVGPPPGTTQLSFAIEAGRSIMIGEDALRAYRPMNISTAQSSTPIVTTASADVSYTFWAR